MSSPPRFARSAAPLAGLLLLGACAQVNVAPSYVAPPVATVQPVMVPVDRDTVLDLPPELASSVTIVEPPPPVVLVPPPPVVLLPPPPPIPPLLIFPPDAWAPGAWIPVTR
jgi:hypothetical protein